MGQFLQTGRASQAAVAQPPQQGPGGSLHYSTAPAAAAENSRSFCMSKEKGTMQQLNARLALYLQQVQRLKETNQKLERLIEEQLDRKCPRELRELDGHLRAGSELQHQISDCLSAQAQVKLQLLSAEMDAVDLNNRLEKEHKQRCNVETELSDLRLIWEELMVHKLPQLESLVTNRSQQLMELRLQHQQNMQGLLKQASEGVSVTVQTTGRSDLMQQLDELRQSSVTLQDQKQTECWFNTQASSLSSPEVNFDSAAGSEVLQAELKELRRTATSLEDELTTLKALNIMLEGSGLEQNESFVLQLEALQQRADGLCLDLDAVLQATAEKTSEQHTLLDITTRLEAEIEDYKRLLDGLNPQRFSGRHSISVTKVPGFCATSSPSTLRRNIAADKTVSVQRRTLKTKVPQISATMSSAQTITVDSKRPKSQTVISVNASNRTGSFAETKNKRTEEETVPIREKHDSQSFQNGDAVKASKAELNTLNAMPSLDNQSVTVTTVKAEPGTVSFKTTDHMTKIDPTEETIDIKKENKDPAQVLSMVVEEIAVTSSEVSLIGTKQNILMTSEDTGSTTEDASFSSTETNEKLESETAQEITLSVKSVETASAQAEPEPLTAEQNILQADLQADVQATNIQTVNAETDVKESPELETQMTMADPIIETTAETKEHNEDPAQGSEERQSSLYSEASLIHVEDGKEASVRTSVVPECRIVQSEVFPSELSLISDKEIKRIETLAEEVLDGAGALPEDRSDQNFLASPEGQNKDTTIADSRSVIESASLNSTESSEKSEGETAQEITISRQSVEIASVQAEPEPEPVTSDQNILQADSKSDIEVTNTQTVTTETILCTESDELVTHMTKTYNIEEAAAEIMKENEAPAQVLSSFVEDVAVSSEERQSGLSSEASLIDDNDVEVPDKHTEKEVVKEEVSLASIIEKEPESAEILKKVEEVSKSEGPISVSEINNVTMTPGDLGSESNLPDQEALQGIKDSTKFTSRTDSGVILSSSSAEEILGQRGLVLDQETCLSSVEPEMLMSMNDHVFCPVDLDFTSPDSVLSPEPELCFSPSDTCLSPVENKMCLSPDFEDDGEACLSLTEASVHIRPVEKYVLTTKEEGESPSFSNDQGLPEEDGGKARVPGSDTLNGTNANHKSTSCEIESLPGAVEVTGPGDRSIKADKEKLLGFRGLFQRSVANIPRDGKTTAGGIPNTQNVVKPSASQGSTNGTSSSGKVSDKTSAPASAGIQARRGSSDWMIANSPGKAKASPSGVQIPASNQPETGRFGRRGSGELMTYGSLGRKSSLDSSIRLSKVGQVKGPPVVSDPVSIPQEQGRFGRRGSGEWKVYGGSPGSSSDGTCNTEKRESLPPALLLSTSPPETGRFGSRGSGEWRAYGGSPGRISSWAGCSSLPNANSKESPLGDKNLPASEPQAVRAGRFVRGGSGEWKVYGSGCSDRISVSSNSQNVISPPGSRSSASSGGRLSSSSVVRRSSSVGSGGRLGSSSRSLSSSSTGRFGSTNSGEWKPVYSSSSGRKSSAGSGRSGSNQRAPSPGGRMSVSAGSGGWLSSSLTSGTRISSSGSGTHFNSAGSIEKTSSQAGGRMSSSSGSGRTSSAGGRVIVSSNHPIRSTGSGAGSKKERISVCKMAALSISAAGREKNKDRKRQSDKSQQQKQAPDTSPLVQRWLITGVGASTADQDNADDDIMRL